RALLECANPGAKLTKKECRASHERIAERFRRVTGLTPVKYAKELQFAMAEWLIRWTDRKLAAVATQCGFNHYHCFARAFRRKFSLSPSQARARWKREAARKPSVAPTDVVVPPPATATPVDPRSAKRAWRDRDERPGVPLPLPLGQTDVTSRKPPRDQVSRQNVV
ncbi:MAG: helix-turn-helix transcriptional regulator, partial [Planctomycetes bacterium]|nr:helix-turn-helix transcriptional regulator [Planctomycetota bacterium]